MKGHDRISIIPILEKQYGNSSYKCYNKLELRYFISTTLKIDFKELDKEMKLT